MAQTEKTTAKEQQDLTTLVINPRGEVDGITKGAQVRLDLVQEDGVSVFRSRGIDRVRGRVHKGEDGAPDGRIDLTYKKNDGSEIGIGVLFVNQNAETGAKYLGGYAAGLEQRPNPQNEARPFVNLIPGAEGRERIVVNAQIFGTDAEAIFEALPVYTAKAPAAEAEAEPEKKAAPKL